MSDSIVNGIIAIAIAVVGLAIWAVIVGKNSQTAGVIKASGDAFTQIIKAAVSPVA